MIVTPYALLLNMYYHYTVRIINDKDTPHVSIYLTRPCASFREVAYKMMVNVDDTGARNNANGLVRYIDACGVLLSWFIMKRYNVNLWIGFAVSEDLGPDKCCGGGSGHLRPSRPRLVPVRPKVCTSHVREPLRFPKRRMHYRFAWC